MGSKVAERSERRVIILLPMIMEGMFARALYIAFDVYPRPKGSSSHIRSMLAALANDFRPVCALCLGGPELPLVEEQDGLTIYRLPGQHRDVLARATAFAHFVEFHARRLAGSLECLVYRDPWGGVPATRVLPGVPSIFEVNALPSWEMVYSRPGFADSHPLQAKIGDMERFCLRTAASVLCVSGVTRRALVAEGVDPTRIAVIPNSAAPFFFQADTAANPIPELEANDWCGYVGGLQPWQGVEFLIEAFALTTTGRLLIVHSGNRGTRELERRMGRLGLRERVLLHGPLSPEALAGVLARLRFTVAPLAETRRNTWQGCCPVKIVESMAAGTPVIASDLAVARELVRDGEDGLLAAPGDRRAWAVALQRLFLDAELRDKLAKNAIRTACEHFAQSIAHEKLRSIFLAVQGGSA